MKNKFLSVVTVLMLLVGCTSQPVYKNITLSPAERADDLLARLTLEEKTALMLDVSAPVERLGIKPYNWWNEALHGVARNGLATVFPQPLGMAASFSPEALQRVFTAVSDEARAKNTRASVASSYERYEGLTMWTPNINIYRDPRWGRGFETYGEDPYLTEVMGLEVVKGLQGPLGETKYDKLHACAKHFAVHSGPEWNRHEFNAENIAPRDLYETYLPAFEALVKEGKVKEVMCAYNRFEGDPCCGSDRLLMKILREEWGYDGIVVADCGAIADFYRDKGHHTHPDAASASADAVRSGTDLDCGSSYKALAESVRKGLIAESDLDVSVRRLLKARFELGEMDDPAEVSWTGIPYSVVASDFHDSLALDMARRSMTLLMNRDGMLPLRRGGQTIAVVGPNANDSVMQWGNYNGTPRHTMTILEGIRRALAPTDRLIYEPGCSWVEPTLTKSVFRQCTADGETGFMATYWNNKEAEGEPVATSRLTTPFRLCISGATVFAPGVNLTDFAASYRSTFVPEETGEVVFDFYSCGATQVLVNGEIVKKFTNKHGSRGVAHTLHVERGKQYDIEIRFQYYGGDAQLNFDLGFKYSVDPAAVVARVREADVVVFVGGISPALEGEEMGVDLPGFKRGDRTDIELPTVQRDLLRALRAAGKRIVLVNCSGSAVGLEPETQMCDAILQAWYPGQAGGQAVAEVLFGDYNPAGRLPVTFYRNVSQLPDFEDYRMEGHTYRYFRGKPLFPFGHGLSYTTFAYGDLSFPDTVQAGEPVHVCFSLSNTGERDGEEAVQLYLRRHDDPSGPVKTLRAFRRVFVPAGARVDVKLELTSRQLMWWDEQTHTMRALPGVYDVLVGGSSADSALKVRQLIID